MSDAIVPEPAPYPEPRTPLPGLRGRVQRWYARGPGSWDFTIGVVAPLVLVFLDRRVLDGGVLPLRPHSFLLVVASCAILAAWTASHRRSAWWHAMLAGPLLLGAVAAFAIALRILPMAVIGLIVIIGVLGFVPWFTAAVFLRAGLRALAQARRHLDGGPALALAALSAALVFIGCWGVGRVAMAVEHRATEALVAGGPDAERAAWKLKALWAFPQVRLHDLRDAAWSGGDKGKRLRAAFRDITGEDPDSD